MNRISKKAIAALLVISLILPGCLSDEVSEISEMEDCQDDSSCEITDSIVEEEAIEEVISISENNFCDNTNY